MVSAQTHASHSARSSRCAGYTFDAANRLETETNPLLKVTRYTYDAAGNRRTKLDANGHTTTYSYDDNRRLTRVDFDDGTFYEYGFGTRGNRTLEKGPSHERHLHYDGCGAYAKEHAATEVHSAPKYTWRA